MKLTHILNVLIKKVSRTDTHGVIANEVIHSARETLRRSVV